MSNISANGNEYLPNSFQTPNIFVDKLLRWLTPEEAVCLQAATREILGWHNHISDRRAHISLSRFAELTPLEVGGIRSALESLNQYGIMARIGSPTQDGQEWELTVITNPNGVQWEALEQRKADAKAKAKARTKTARQRRAAKKAGVLSDITPNVPQQAGGNVPQQAGVLSDNNNEIQEIQEKHRNTKDSPASAVPASPPANSSGEKLQAPKPTTEEFHALAEALSIPGWFGPKRAMQAVNMVLGTAKRGAWKLGNLDTPLTAKEVRGFPKWYAMPKSSGGADRKGCDLPTAPETFYDYMTAYQQWLAASSGNGHVPDRIDDSEEIMARYGAAG